MKSFPKGETRATQKARERRAVQLARQACYTVVSKRAKGHCERCGIAISPKRPKWHPQRAHMNHKVPLSLGGADDPENCELICQACHMPGGQHAPTTVRMNALKKD